MKVGNANDQENYDIYPEDHDCTGSPHLKLHAISKVKKTLVGDGGQGEHDIA